MAKEKKEKAEGEEGGSRRGFLKSALIVGGGLAVGRGASTLMTPAAAAVPVPRPKNEREITEALAAGNKRFANGLSTHPHLGPDVRAEQLKKQTPFAAVLACSDSRVAPELIFDQGIGDLFVVRIAGNTTPPDAVASLAYAVEHLGVSYILVLGHESCGAVKAAIDALDADAGEFAVLVDPIKPAAAKAVAAETDKAMRVDKAVAENAKAMAKGLTKQSAILRKANSERKLTVHASVFSMATSLVTPQD